METNAFIEELWGYTREVPMGEHPWFQGILQHRWTREQIILGEVQHYLRIRTNPIFFGYMAINAVADKDYELMQTILENFMEELGGQQTHVDIMLQFLEEGGISREEADRGDLVHGGAAMLPARVALVPGGSLDVGGLVAVDELARIELCGFLLDKRLGQFE